MSETNIADIRRRANSVLDGETAHRTRVARDCLLLADEVQRLRQELAVAKAVPKRDIDFASMFGGAR